MASSQRADTLDQAVSDNKVREHILCGSEHYPFSDYGLKKPFSIVGNVFITRLYLYSKYEALIFIILFIPDSWFSCHSKIHFTVGLLV